MPDSTLSNNTDLLSMTEDVERGGFAHQSLDHQTHVKPGSDGLEQGGSAHQSLDAPHEATKQGGSLCSPPREDAHCTSRCVLRGQGTGR